MADDDGIKEAVLALETKVTHLTKIRAILASPDINLLIERLRFGHPHAGPEAARLIKSLQDIANDGN